MQNLSVLKAARLRFLTDLFRNNSIANMSSMLKATRSAKEYLWVHSIAKSGLKKPEPLKSRDALL
jgi:hypothetical protein